MNFIAPLNLNNHKELETKLSQAGVWIRKLHSEEERYQFMDEIPVVLRTAKECIHNLGKEVVKLNKSLSDLQQENERLKESP